MTGQVSQALDSHWTMIVLIVLPLPAEKKKSSQMSE